MNITSELSDSVNITPEMSDSVNNTPEMSDSVNITPEMSDSVNITPEIISEMIIESCIIYPTCNVYSQLAVQNLLQRVVQNDENVRCEFSGSIAEFYVFFPQKSIGDLDVMYSQTDLLAAFEDTLEDPILKDFTEEIKVFKISTDPSVCPLGYACLRFNGMLVFNWKSLKYEHLIDESDAGELYLVNNDHQCETELSCSGPARVERTNDSFAGFATIPTIDQVNSIRCLTWPPIAQLWPTRERKHAWPSSETVLEVLRCGCDLVPVAHRDCKHDLTQWRFSFSRAEIILIRSWTPVQQIVYHMLRYFMKHRLLKYAGKKVKRHLHISC